MIESMLRTTIRSRLRSSFDETIVFTARIGSSSSSPDDIEHRIKLRSRVCTGSGYGRLDLRTGIGRTGDNQLCYPEFQRVPACHANRLRTGPPKTALYLANGKRPLSISS